MNTAAIEKPRTASAPKEYLHLGLGDFIWPLAFMLSATMIGLRFPPGYLFMLIVLVNRFLKDKYDFAIQLTLFCGGYSLFNFSDIFLPIDKLTLLASVAAFMLLKKNPIINRLGLLTAIYVAGLVAFAMTSEESLRIQLTGLTSWVSICYLFIPIAIFSGREFDMRTFCRHLFPYAFIFCAYYILDGFILCGYVTMPRDASALSFDIHNTFYNLSMAPLSMAFVRVWPNGMLIFLLCLYPLAKLYKLTPLQWGLVILALAASRTTTFLVGILAGYVIAQGNFKNILKYTGIVAGMLVLLYFIDSEPVEHGEYGMTSTLRIKSTVRQFTDIENVQFDEDIAQFGSNRMAQILPKMEHLYHLHREWLGFGFLSKTETKNQKFVIENDLYLNPDDAEEVAINVEFIPVEIILNVGYLGLIFHLAFFVALWFVLRHLRYSQYYIVVAGAFVIIGFGGFSGLIRPTSLYMVGLSIAAIILSNKRSLKGFALPASDDMNQIQENAYDKR